MNRKKLVLRYMVNDGLTWQEEEFNTLEEVRGFLDGLTHKAKYHILWFHLLKRISSGTYTVDSYRRWLKGKTKHNIPEKS